MQIIKKQDIRLGISQSILQCLNTESIINNYKKKHTVK